jgi:hypothetical protein
MAEKKQTAFATLNAINVRDKVETKGKVEYLSWAFAWQMLKELYPTAQRVVYENPMTGLNFFTDGKTAYVKVGIAVDGIEHIDYLPVMDFRNASIPLEKITSMDVNKTIQRSTAKAIALHGLGLALWTGEDLPEAVTQVVEKEVTLKTLKVGDENWDKVATYVSHNVALGFEKIEAQLSRKYKLNEAVKIHIRSIISQANND